MIDATDFIRIEIVEIENRNIYRVWHDGAVLIKRTTRPLAAAARILLARGADPDGMIEMARLGRDQVDMRATIKNAALSGGKRRLEEDGTGLDGQSDNPAVLQAAPPALKRPLMAVRKGRL